MQYHFFRSDREFDFFPIVHALLEQHKGKLIDEAVFHGIKTEFVKYANQGLQGYPHRDYDVHSNNISEESIWSDIDSSLGTEGNFILIVSENGSWYRFRVHDESKTGIAKFKNIDVNDEIEQKQVVSKDLKNDLKITLSPEPDSWFGVHMGKKRVKIYKDVHGYPHCDFMADSSKSQDLRFKLNMNYVLPNTELDIKIVMNMAVLDDEGRTYIKPDNDLLNNYKFEYEGNYIDPGFEFNDRVRSSEIGKIDDYLNIKCIMPDAGERKNIMVWLTVTSDNRKSKAFYNIFPEGARLLHKKEGAVIKKLDNQDNKFWEFLLKSENLFEENIRALEEIKQFISESCKELESARGKTFSDRKAFEKIKSDLIDLKNHVKRLTKEGDEVNIKDHFKKLMDFLHELLSNIRTAETYRDKKELKSVLKKFETRLMYDIDRVTSYQTYLNGKLTGITKIGEGPIIKEIESIIELIDDESKKIGIEFKIQKLDKFLDGGKKKAEEFITDLELMIRSTKELITDIKAMMDEFIDLEI